MAAAGPDAAPKRRHKVTWNADAIQDSLLEAEKSLLSRLTELAEGQKLDISGMPAEDVPLELAKRLASSQEALALRRSHRRAGVSFLNIWKTGGMEGWAVDIRLAALDSDSDGLLDDETVSAYFAMGEKIVTACESFATNNGVVAALMISVLLPVTIDFFIQYDDIFPNETVRRSLENDPNASDVLKVLVLDGRYGGWDSVDVSFYFNAVAFCLLNVATLLSILLMGASAYAVQRASIARALPSERTAPT